MLGAPDPIYTEARRALLDMLDALAQQRDAVVLVGAQAVYLHVGESDLAVAPFTTDADLALDPRHLLDRPLLEQALQAHGFLPSEQSGAIGTWIATGKLRVPVDLLVPESLDTEGGRAARLGDHGSRTARRARGLEAAMVDRERRVIAALDPADQRKFELWVAGPAALLVTKLIKIAERSERPHRLKDKDALDAYRLLRGISTEDLCRRLEQLRLDSLARSTTEEALAFLAASFTAQGALGCEMVARAVAGLEDEAQTALSCAILAQDLVQALEA